MSRSSIKKIFWRDISRDVLQVNPEFHREVELNSPGNDYPIYLLDIPYGDVIGDELSQFIPDNEGGYTRLNSSELPNQIVNDLGYGAETSPLGLLLHNNMEFYVDLKAQRQTLPFAILKPGRFYNPRIVLKESENEISYAPSDILKANSGARTIFALPYLTCQTSFTRLHKEIGNFPIPVDIYDHCDFFKTILNNINSKWSTKLIYFSKKWVDSIMLDPKWLGVKNHIKNVSPTADQHSTSEPYFHVFYSLLLNNVSHVVNPYLTDTLRHVFNILLGAYPGLAPVCDESLVPLRDVQHILTYSYGLKKYYPCLIGPEFFDYKRSKDPVYYSLQYPTTVMFSPRKKKNSSALEDLNSLEGLFAKFIPEILEKDSLKRIHKLIEALKCCDLSFIHNQNQESTNITQIDKRFSYTTLLLDDSKYKEALNGKLFRGCIRLAVK